MKILKPIIILVSISYLLASTKPVLAQSISLSISPPVTEILLQPNKKVSQTFNLQVSGNNLTATPEIHLVSPADQTGHVKIDPKPISPSALPLTITSSTHPLNTPFPLNGETVPVTLTFEAASSDVSEDLYLALIFKINSSGDPLKNNSAATPAISALILTTITPTGVLPINLEVKNFTPPYIHDSATPLTSSPSIANNSPIMIRSVGKFEIIAPGGKTVFTLPLYPNLVLGNSTRDLQGSDKDAVDTQLESDAKPLPLTWYPKISSIGPHRIRLTITTLGGTTISELEKIVWILPLRLTIVTISLLILIIIIYRGKIKKLPIDKDMQTL